MTSAIADLRARLGAINVHTERQSLRIDISGMAAERRKIEALANRTANGAGASKNRIVTAIEAFRQTGELADVRAARLVCWGITEHTTDDAPILIEDTDRFDRLLKLARKIHPVEFGAPSFSIWRRPSIPDCPRR